MEQIMTNEPRDAVEHLQQVREYLLEGSVNSMLILGEVDAAIAALSALPTANEPDLTLQTLQYEAFLGSESAAEACTNSTLATEASGEVVQADRSGPHESHILRASDASTFDVICTVCSHTDVTGGGWGKLVEPCKSLAHRGR